MTTIVYRDGVMAADSRAFAGDRNPIGYKTKIRAMLVEDVAYLVGVSSPAPGYGEAVLNWFEAGMDIHDTPPMPEQGFTLLAVDAAGQGYYAANSFYLSGPLENDWWAIGSGDEFAIGALTSGSDAADAVRVASLYDQWTGGPIHTLTFVTEDDKITVVKNILE